MSYTVNNPPDRIKELPSHAQVIWISAFNSALDQYKDEGKANAVAWAAIGNKYKKVGDKWVPKETSEKKITQMIMYPIAFSEEFDETTTEIQIIPVGFWNHSKYGKMKITEEDIALFVKNFESGVRNELAITEGHSVASETKPAIGWFKKLMNKGRDGLWAIIEWTEKGKQLIQEKAYKYFSPEFYTNYEDPETRKTRKDVLVGGALVNRPYFKSMPAVVLSEEIIIKKDSMNIEEIIIKNLEELTDEEKDFLKDNKDELSDEDKAKFASVIEENAETDEEKEEREKEEKEKADTDAKKEKDEKEAKEKEDKEKKIANEKNNNVLISKETLRILNEKAQQGADANEKLHKQEMAIVVDNLTFSEHNSIATFLPKSKDKVVDFLLSLTESQVKKFQEIIAELPEIKVFGELGGDSGLPVADDKKFSELVSVKMKADKNLTYREAADQVIAENLELAKKLAS